MNESTKLFSIATGIMVLIIIFSVALTLGARMEIAADIPQPAYATGSLHTNGNITMDGITTIGTIAYQYTFEAEEWSEYTVPVVLSTENGELALIALAEAINNNATSSAILTATSVASEVMQVTYDTTGVVGNGVATTTDDDQQIWGNPTLTGGVDDAGWASSDQTTGADVWADNATFIALAVMILVISVLLGAVLAMRKP